MNVVAVVLAGGEGTRLYPLTAEHAKPALPFLSGYRLVDFVLSNLVNSGISTIYVLAQYKPGSLVRHIETAWAPWFEGSAGMLKVLLPRSNTYGGRFKGTADAVGQYLDVIQAHRPDVVAVFAADHIYRMDVRQMALFHREQKADVTVAAVSVPIERAASFGILGASASGRVREFREKPQQPPALPHDPSRAYASMGNYLFQPDVLEAALAEGRLRGENDFGADVLPRLSGTRRVFAYDFSHNEIPGVQEFEERAYWRDVGTLAALAAAQQDATGQRPRFDLRNRRWPIRGEHDTALLATVRNLTTGIDRPVADAARPLADAPVMQKELAWRGAGRDRHSEERPRPS